MKRALAIVAWFCASCALVQSVVAVPQPRWQLLTIIEKGDIKISLEYLPEASVADDEWLRWVFENRGKKEVLVLSMSYRLTTTCALPLGC